MRSAGRSPPQTAQSRREGGGYRDNGRHHMDCRSCGHAAKVEKVGSKLLVTCFGGCGQEAALGNVDSQEVLSELNGNSAGVHKGKGDVALRGSNPNLNPPPPPTPSELPEEEEPSVEWYLRAYKAGDVQPKPVELPPLPASATPAMKKVAEHYRLVLGLRALDPSLSNKPEVPYACDWVAKETGLSGKGVAWTLHKLVACGVLKRGGNLPPRPWLASAQARRPVHTYLPGDGR